MMHHLLNQRSSFSLPDLLLISLSSFIIITITPCYCQPLLISCSNDTANSTLTSNVNILLESLSSQASSNTFYNETSDGIHGLFLCRGDVSVEECRSCVSIASQQIMQNCSSSTTNVMIRYDHCMLRYSVINFFGIVDMTSIIQSWNNSHISSTETDYGSLALIQELISRVSQTDNMYMADRLNLMEPRYGSVQCTRDINMSQCQSCLRSLMDFSDQCCRMRIGWRIFSPSCYIRFEDYPFFNIPAQVAPPQPLSELPQPPPDNDEGNTTRIIAITISTVAAMAILLGLLYYAFFCRKRSQERDKSEELPLQNSEVSKSVHFMRRDFQSRNDDNDVDMHYFSLSILKAATDNFSDANRLGEGGFGPVYKGKLISGEEIAVKRLSAKSSQGHEEFKNEAKVIWKLQHKNLVRLLGCCLDGDEKLLVYEYMANTSLDAFLFDPLKCKQLDWLKRESIVNGIARGILYLHEDSRLKIIHRDLKASNILLDDEMNAKISDFGTARIFGGKQIDASTNRIVGTYGYMAPEYAMEGLFSVKSDVYSFGVLMLEVISGRKSIGFLNVNRADNLLSHAWELWNEGRAQEMIDKNLGGDCPMREALKWIHIALLCVQEDANIRPTMSMVVLMLGSQSNALPQPLKPPFLSGGGVLMFDLFSTTGTGTGSFITDQSSTSSSL